MACARVLLVEAEHLGVEHGGLFGRHALPFAVVEVHEPVQDPHVRDAAFVCDHLRRVDGAAERSGVDRRQAHRRERLGGLDGVGPPLGVQRDVAAASVAVLDVQRRGAVADQEELSYAFTHGRDARLHLNLRGPWCRGSLPSGREPPGSRVTVARSGGSSAGVRAVAPERTTAQGEGSRRRGGVAPFEPKEGPNGLRQVGPTVPTEIGRTTEGTIGCVRYHDGRHPRAPPLGLVRGPYVRSTSLVRAHDSHPGPQRLLEHGARPPVGRGHHGRHPGLRVRHLRPSQAGRLRLSAKVVVLPLVNPFIGNVREHGQRARARHGHRVRDRQVPHRGRAGPGGVEPEGEPTGHPQAPERQCRPRHHRHGPELQGPRPTGRQERGTGVREAVPRAA